MRGIKKTVFTLNIDNYAPEITALTYPLMKYWAHKIGADFHVITERKFPDMPVTYEKLQIYELSKQMGNDWNIYVDSDAVIHPDTIDWTAYLKKDTIAHHGRDFANIRWRYNDCFLRDGRNWGSANWFTIASDWCIDIWKPLEESLPWILDQIYPTIQEHNGVVNTSHLIDDFAVSYNIAKYGIKATTIQILQKELGFDESGFMFHLYNVTEHQKMNGYTGTPKSFPGIPAVIKDVWNIPEHIQNYGK